MMDSPIEKLAVLIDAANTPAAVADGLFQEIAGLGDAIVRRVYGDFTHPYNKAWKSMISRLAVKPVQAFPNYNGHNAPGVALIIDAMDLLHSGLYDGFCLVSSDNDLTGLAQRIHEAGAKVYGFGDEKTPDAFRNACNSFTLTNDLFEEEPEYRPRQDSRYGDGVGYFPFVKFIDKAIYRLQKDTDGPVLLSQVGATLQRIDPTFDPKRYGYERLIDMFQAVPKRYSLTGEGGTLAVQITRRPETHSDVSDYDTDLDNEPEENDDQLGGFGTSEQ